MHFLDSWLISSINHVTNIRQHDTIPKQLIFQVASLQMLNNFIIIASWDVESEAILQLRFWYEADRDLKSESWCVDSVQSLP